MYIPVVELNQKEIEAVSGGTGVKTIFWWTVTGAAFIFSTIFLPRPLQCCCNCIYEAEKKVHRNLRKRDE